MLEFFRTGKLLKAINATSITLIPKVKSPTHVSDYRPISCCSVIYKCITKLLCEKLRLVLPSLVSETQGAFVSGRSILHNILLCQDIVRIYKGSQKQKCCMMKIDLQKAYITVCWEFLEDMMKGLHFPDKFIHLVMTCVSSPTFTLMLNGFPTGFFNSKRGLRQGDPMSPLLFVLCMEYFTRIMAYIGKQDQFRFHPRCQSLKLNHLCFADDLILFCKGDYASVLMMLQGLRLFADSTSLVASPQKSVIFGCGMTNQDMQRLVDCSGFKQDTLPFRYLGVPISTKKLLAADCEQLLEKMLGRIRCWSSRNISFAGRRLLVNSVLLSISVYWAQIFILPKNIIKQINAICRSFLWTGAYNSTRLGYVCWTEVCSPKYQGGLVSDV